MDPFTPTDFMPWVEKPEPEKVEPEQNQEALLAAFGYRENT